MPLPSYQQHCNNTMLLVFYLEPDCFPSVPIALATSDQKPTATDQRMPANPNTRFDPLLDLLRTPDGMPADPESAC